MDNEKQLVFNLIIDERREYVLNLMAQYANNDSEFKDVLEERGYGDDLESFYGDMIEGCKKVAWCNHPDCRGTDYKNCNHK